MIQAVGYKVEVSASHEESQMVAGLEVLLLQAVDDVDGADCLVSMKTSNELFEWHSRSC